MARRPPPLPRPLPLSAAIHTSSTIQMKREIESCRRSPDPPNTLPTIETSSVYKREASEGRVSGQEPGGGGARQERLALTRGTYTVKGGKSVGVFVCCCEDVVTGRVFMSLTCSREMCM